MTQTRRPRRRPPAEVDRQDPLFSLEAVVAEMPTTHVECRDYGHKWGPFGAANRVDGAYEQTLRCARCRTERWRMVDANTGALLGGPRYDYAKGYRIKGLGHIRGAERDLVRLTSIRRSSGLES